MEESQKCPVFYVHFDCHSPYENLPKRAYCVREWLRLKASAFTDLLALLLLVAFPSTKMLAKDYDSMGKTLGRDSPNNHLPFH